MRYSLLVAVQALASRRRLVAVCGVWMDSRVELSVLTGQSFESYLALPHLWLCEDVGGWLDPQRVSVTGALLLYRQRWRACLCVFSSRVAQMCRIRMAWGMLLILFTSSLGQYAFLGGDRGHFVRSG